MNIKHTFNALLFAVFGMVSLQSAAQKVAMPAPSPLQTVTQRFGLGEVTVEYSRPAVKGRKIFGDVVPFGKIWRTGANATTKITFTDDVQLEGKAVKAGTYGIYSIPDKDSWQIMLYSDLELAGNVADYKQEKEVLRFTVKSARTAVKVESLTIGFDNVMPTEATLSLMWENTAVAIRMTTDIDARVMKSIEESMKSDKPDYFRAASYYFENGKDLKQALAWATKATEDNPKAFYMMYLKAKIEYALKDDKAGRTSAEKTIVLAQEAKNDDYVALGNKLLNEHK